MSERQRVRDVTEILLGYRWEERARGPRAKDFFLIRNQAKVAMVWSTIHKGKTSWWSSGPTTLERKPFPTKQQAMSFAVRRFILNQE